MIDKKKHINICFITREYAHDAMGKTGGIGVFVKQFTSVLKAHEFTITVFAFGATAKRFNDEGVRVVRIKDLTTINEAIKSPMRRYRLPGYLTVKRVLEFFNRLYVSLYLTVFVKRNGFDLVEFHDYGGDAPFFISRIPKVVRCHGSAMTLHQFMGYPKRQPDAYYEGVFFKRFQKHVLAVSQYSANTTASTFKLNNVPKVIYNGVTLPEVAHCDDYLSAPTVPFSIFYFGSIRERKGIAIACNVFDAIAKVYPEASFHVMGNNNNDYWNTHAVKLLSNAALERTHYYGAVPHKAVASYLQTAHVVLFPSYGENFSIGLLEVMALEKIVVVSAIDSFKEVIVDKDNGFMCDTIPSYIDTVQSIFEGHYDVLQIAKNARRTVAQNFDQEQVIQETITYYKMLLEKET